MAANAQHRCVFVGNIPYDASEEQLVQICEEVGPVVSFRLVIDRETGKPKGYGFCEYKDEETALSARRNLQGYEINGRQLRVDFAENDKGADRNREQGRGGPGFTSSVDAQRPLGGPPILGDSALHLPIGIPLAGTAASIMAGALGGVQTDSLSAKQSGLQSQSGLGNDPLSHYLANMSKKQLFEVLSDMKAMAAQNKELARQLLIASPQLAKALFQAEIMLGMVPPQVLQMPNIRQSSSSFLQPTQDGIQDQKPAALPPHPGQTPVTQDKMQFGLMPRVQEGHASSLPPNAQVINQPSAHPFQHGSMQPRFQLPLQAQNQLPPQAQNQLPLQITMPAQSGVSTVPSMQSFTGFSIRPQPPAMETSVALNQKVQVPLVPRPGEAGSLGNNTRLVLPLAARPHTPLSRPPTSQPNFQPGSSNSMLLSGAPETVNKHAAPKVTDRTTWIPRSSAYSNFPLGAPEQTSMVGGALEPNHPSKLARLEDGRRAIRTSQNNTTISGSGLNPGFGASSLPADRTPSVEVAQHYDKQIPQLQLAPEVESALLQQVKSLTPEQLSSLPPEQRQQVIQLQQMLRQV